MSLKLNGSTGYLEYPGKLVSAFPFSMMVWVSADSTGSGQFWVSQGQSSADRYGAAWLDANGTTIYGNFRNPGNGVNAQKISATVNATMRLAVVVFTSTTSRTIYYGSSTGDSNTTSVTDDVTNHDRFVVGAHHYNSSSPSLFLNGNVAETHVFNVALSSTDVANLLADSVKPEAITGWVDGWTLKDYNAGGTYTSLNSGSPKTLTAVGSVIAGTQSHPITRSSAPTLTGSITLDDVTTLGGASSGVSSLSGTVVMDDILASGGAGLVPGSVKTLPFSRNNGTRPSGLTGVALAVLTDDANLSRVAGSTALAQALDGTLTFSGAGLPSVGSVVIVVTREPDGKLGVERYSIT